MNLWEGAMTNPIPPGYHTLTPFLVFKNARRAIDFYKKAFRAKEKSVIPGPNGQGVMHAEIQIGDSILMMEEENPQNKCKSAESAGFATTAFSLYVPNVDKSFQEALAAGAQIEKPVEDMFWGDRAGVINDPFGYTWWILTHKKDLSDEELRKATEEAMSKVAV
jgi:PhnB protein